MTEAVVETTPKAVAIKPNTGFAARSALEERIEKEEKELKVLIEKNNNQAKEDQEDDDVDPSLSKEEQSFKKRYGDLRRHSQKQQVDLQKQIDELKTQLEASTKKQIKLPKSEQELEQWTREYPDVAKIVETIAIKKAKEQAQTIEERLKELDAMQYNAKKDKAEAELMRLHSDFDKIRETDEFHEWVENQPKWVQQALYENDTDAVSAARAIDLYKADMGINIKRKSSRENERDAAKSVINSRSSGPDRSESGGVIKESEVEKMSAREYESRQEEIVAAIKAGKFIYDLSGSAR